MNPDFVRQEFRKAIKNYDTLRKRYASGHLQHEGNEAYFHGASIALQDMAILLGIKLEMEDED